SYINTLFRFCKGLLVIGENIYFNNFRTHIHSYNAAFRFAGVSDNKDLSFMGSSSWLYREAGNMYHIMRPIIDNTGSPNITHLYLLDPKDASNIRSYSGRRGT
ncbi:hypothetical protein CDIK_2458, partial [Cucumispora dikerogammari]